MRYEEKVGVGIEYEGKGEVGKEKEVNPRWCKEKEKEVGRVKEANQRWCKEKEKEVGRVMEANPRIDK